MSRGGRYRGSGPKTWPKPPAPAVRRTSPEPAGRNGSGPVVAAVGGGELGHAHVVIGDVADGRLPAAWRALQDGVARMRRARLHRVRDRRRIAIAGAADAARIDHQPPVTEA